MISRSAELVWSHYGERYCVDNELNFSREESGEWLPWEPDPSSSVFSSAADGVSPFRWDAFLQFVPAAQRRLLEQFDTGRMAVLAVVAYCPGLVEDLLATPALAPFVAEHVRLRGATAPCWEEIEAVHARGGVYGLLEWLGMPASRQTITILQKITNPDLGRRLLAPIRSSLWEPETIWFLQHTPQLTERQLMHHCECVAA
ncbi:MAG: hypothetical protein QM790_01215 [Nibricoccus sp.]